MWLLESSLPKTQLMISMPWMPDGERWFATLFAHLTDEPTKQRRSRIKRLRDVRHPQFRLRIGEIRVFNDVTAKDDVIIAIMSKEETIQWLEEAGEK